MAAEDSNPLGWAMSQLGATRGNGDGTPRSVSTAGLEGWRDWKNLDVEDEKDLCEQILEHRRVQNLQVELEVSAGRPVTVQEWAMAAGHPTAHQLFAALQEGRKAERTLVFCHQGLVRSVANRYASLSKSLSCEDLVQEGSMGLLQAVSRFDPTKGCRFSSYAVFRIKASILRAIANKDRLIRVPVHAQDAAMRLLAAEHALQSDSGLGATTPTDAQLALALTMPEDTVALYRRGLPLQRHVAKLDHPAISHSAVGTDIRGGGLGSEQWPWTRVGGGEAPRLAEMTLVREDMLRVMRECLTPEELQALRLRFGMGEASGGRQAVEAALTFKEIGGMMEISGEGIRRMVHRAMEKLEASDEANGLMMAMALAWSVG